MDHLLGFGEKAGVKLPGDPAEAPLGGFEDGHIHLCPSSDHFLIRRPGELLERKFGIRPDQVVDPFAPECRITFYSLPR